MKGLWLIGFRGAGKSTLGRRIAEMAKRPFLDLDEEWEKRAGESILAFVAREGIERFREGERALLSETAERMQRGEGLVAATGGGFVDWAPSREVVEASPHPKLFLNPPAELLWERLQKDKNRLKIGELNDFTAMRSLWEKRGPFYEKIATFVWINRDISESLASVEKLFQER